MARLGKRERMLRRQQWQQYNAIKQSVIADNLASPKPARSLLSRDETAILMRNTHTRGIRIGHRRLRLIDKEFTR